MRVAKPNFPALVLMSAIALAGGAIHQSSAEEVYKWEDDSGTIHYTEYPPKDRESQKVKTYSTRRTTAARREPPEQQNPQNGEPASVAAATPPKFEKDPERCSVAKQNLATLEQHARVRALGADGTPYFLTPEQKQDRIEKARKAIEESC